MQIYAEQLGRHLSQHGLAPFYLLFGDEDFLKDNCRQQLRAFAKEQGFTTRIQLTQDKEFQWERLLFEYNSPSFFADKKLIELELPDAKPGRQGSKVITDLVAQVNPNNLIVFLGPYVRKQTQNSAWFKALEQTGVYTPLYPLKKEQLPQYIQQRAQEHQVQLEPSATQLLIQRFEGNLLALDQELIKLSLLSLGDASRDQAKIWQASDIEAITQTQSRYDIFTLRDALLAQDLPYYLHILERLFELGEEPTLILWTLSKLQQALFLLASARGNQTEEQTVFLAENIWNTQQGLYRRFLPRYSRNLNHSLLLIIQQAELSIKRDSFFDIKNLLAQFGITLLHSQEVRHYLDSFLMTDASSGSPYASS